MSKYIGAYGKLVLYLVLSIPVKPYKEPKSASVLHAITGLAGLVN